MRASYLLFVAAFGIAGCIDPQTAPARRDLGLGADPGAQYKKVRLASAMRGLTYDSGLVKVDCAAAARIARPGTVAQAAPEFERGERLLAANDSIGAITAFTKAVVIAERHAPFYVGLGRALITKGKGDEAAAAFQTALLLDWRNPETNFEMAYMLDRQGKLPEAVEAWTTVVEFQPQNAEAQERLAIGLYYMGKYRNAWQHVQAAEALGRPAPPQFRELLKAQMPEPGN